MKIRDGLQSLYKPDLFNSQNQKVKNSTDSVKTAISSDTKQTEKNNTADFSLTKVLSVKEINSLNALFGFEQGSKEGLYGNNKMRNVHAGMLLDVKG